MNNAQCLMLNEMTIDREGLREPIEVLEVEGQYYGFSGCHMRLINFWAKLQLSVEYVARLDLCCDRILLEDY